VSSRAMRCAIHSRPFTRRRGRGFSNSPGRPTPSHCDGAGNGARSDEIELSRPRTREHLVELLGIQPVHAREEPGQDGSVFVEYRVVTVLKQRRRSEQRLLAGNTPSSDATTEYPVNAAVAVIGPAVSVLTKRAPEFAQHDDNRISPWGVHFLGEGGQPAPQLL